MPAAANLVVYATHVFNSSHLRFSPAPSVQITSSIAAAPISQPKSNTAFTKNTTLSPEMLWLWSSVQWLQCNGFAYSSKTCDDISMDVVCALINPAITHESHDNTHILFMSLDTHFSDDQMCNCCSSILTGICYECSHLSQFQAACQVRAAAGDCSPRVRPASSAADMYQKIGNSW